MECFFLLSLHASGRRGKESSFDWPFDSPFHARDKSEEFLMFQLKQSPSISRRRQTEIYKSRKARERTVKIDYLIECDSLVCKHITSICDQNGTFIWLRINTNHFLAYKSHFIMSGDES